MHGGSTKAARAVSAANVREREAARYSSPRRSTPEDALEEELHRTLGQIDWLNGRLAETPNDQALHTAQARERDRLTKITDQMMKKNVRQRKVVLTEGTVELLDDVLRGVVVDLGKNPDDPQISAIIARNLSRVLDAPGEDSRPSAPAPDVIEAQPVAF